MPDSLRIASPVEFPPSGFVPLFDTDRYRIGLVGYTPRFAAFGEMERHNKTDEFFVLLKGEADLYTEEGGKPRKEAMCPAELYRVPLGMWHHLVISPDAKVLIIENYDISGQDTEKKRVEGN